MPGGLAGAATMSHAMSHIKKLPPRVWPLSPAAVVALILSLFLAFPASAHAHATMPSKPQPSAADVFAPPAIVKTAIRHALDACSDTHLASVGRVTSAVPEFTACHQGCGGCDGCPHHCKTCASSSCGGGHSHALISGQSPGFLAATWRTAPSPLDEGPDGLGPMPQFEPPRA